MLALLATPVWAHDAGMAIAGGGSRRVRGQHLRFRFQMQQYLQSWEEQNKWLCKTEMMDALARVGMRVQICTRCLFTDT